MENGYSPIKAKRSEEKASLQFLNSRLENYTLKVGQFREHNAALQLELEQVKTRLEKEHKSTIARYEKDLETLRKELEEETEQRARFQVLEQEQHQELDILRPLTAENKQLQLKCDSLQSNLHSSETMKASLQKELDQVKLDNQGLYRRLSVLEKDTKTMNNSIQCLKEENSKLREENSEYAAGNDSKLGQIHRDYASKIEALQIQHKSEQDERTAKAIFDLRSHCDAVNKQNEARIVELMKENEGLKKELESSMTNLEETSKILSDTRELTRHVEIQLRNEQKKRKDERQVLEKDLERAQEARLAKENEFNDLMDVKIALDAEISAYSSILEREESRVGIETPKKRRRSSSHSSSGKKQRNHISVVIKSLDLKSGCIVLENTSEKSTPLKGWVVKSVTADHTFVFPDNYVLAAKQNVSVWSGKKNKGKHQLPSELFWTKKFIWNPHGDAAVLLNPEGYVVSQIAEGMEFPVGLLRKIEDYDVDAEDGKSACHVM